MVSPSDDTDFKFEESDINKLVADPSEEEELDFKFDEEVGDNDN